MVELVFTWTVHVIIYLSSSCVWLRLTCTFIRKKVTSKVVSCRTPVWWKIVFLLSWGEDICSLSSKNSLYLVIICFLIWEHFTGSVLKSCVWGFKWHKFFLALFTLFFVETCVDLNIRYFYPVSSTSWVFVRRKLCALFPYNQNVVKYLWQVKLLGDFFFFIMNFIFEFCGRSEEAWVTDTERLG